MEKKYTTNVFDKFCEEIDIEHQCHTPDNRKV